MLVISKTFAGSRKAKGGWKNSAVSTNEKYMTLNGGSLGSWIDEERSKVR